MAAIVVGIVVEHDVRLVVTVIVSVEVVEDVLATVVCYSTVVTVR